MATLKETLKGKLTKKEQSLLKTSFDQVGEIAILEIDEGLKKKEKLIGEALLKLNKAIKTVVKKTTKHAGEFRLQKYNILAGKRKKETIHKESGIRIKLHIEKTYFSVRSSNERLRLTKLVKPNENILIMFSGCGPYALVLSKHTKAKNITAVEINPLACKYAEENIKLNKIKNITNICKDINKFPTKEKFDRIIMPLPASADQFLEKAKELSKRNTIIHFYDFEKENEFQKGVEKIKKVFPKAKILNIVKTGSPSPRKYRICIDFAVN